MKVEALTVLGTVDLCMLQGVLLLVKLHKHVYSCYPVHSKRRRDRNDDLQPLSTWVATGTSLLTCYAKPSTRPSVGRLTAMRGSRRKLTCFIAGENHGSCVLILVQRSQAKHHKLGCLRYGRLRSRRRSLCDAMLRPCDAACTVGAQSAERSTTSPVRFTSMSPCYQE